MTVMGSAKAYGSPPLRDVYLKYPIEMLQFDLAEGFGSRHRDMPQIEFLVRAGRPHPEPSRPRRLATSTRRPRPLEWTVASRVDGVAADAVLHEQCLSIDPRASVLGRHDAPRADSQEPAEHDGNIERNLTIYVTCLPLGRGGAIIGQDSMSDFDLATSIALGVGLAAATGFRVFLSMLVVSAAAYTGHLPLDENFGWLGTPQALIMLGVAAVVEIVAYYVPVVDNLLDTLATPAAVIAGTLVSAAVMTDLPPMVKWTTAIIAGGGIAVVTQGVTALLRAKSTVLTAGVGNPVIATAELGSSLLLSLLALVAPLIALLVVVVFLWLAIRLILKVVEGTGSSNKLKNQ
jgi:hypothetical protein